MNAPASPLRITQVKGPEELATAIRSATLEPCLLKRTKTMSCLSRMIFPQVCLDFATMGSSFLFTGTLASDCFTVVFVLDCPPQGREFSFGVEHHDGYIFFYPPSAVLDAYTPAGYSSVTLTVPSSLFLRTVARCFPQISERTLQNGACVKAEVFSQRAMRGLLGALMYGLGDMSASFAAQAGRAEQERQLLNCFLNILRDAVVGENPGWSLQAKERANRLSRARNFLSASIHLPVQLDDLCAELGMSRRGVEMMFRKAFDTTPGCFLQRQRLNGARRDLMAGGADSTSVKEVAINWGMLHMGHFSKNYRELFGECPSETLRRRGREGKK